MSDIVLDVHAEIDNLVRNAQIEEEQGWKKPSIYRLRPFISKLSNDKKAYQPQAVSFGPYHHGKHDLDSMDYHKQRAFRSFLNRTPKPQLRELFNSMFEVAQDLKDSYDSLPLMWRGDTKKFVMLMIVDGCFMLEILQVASQLFKSQPCYSDDDPIFGPHGEIYVKSLIRRDMLLLENQLPMLVLFKLKGLRENDEEGVGRLNNLILKFCGDGADGSIKDKCLHVLDLYRKSLLYDGRTKATQQNGSQGPHRTIVIGSATKLTEAGVCFKTSKSKRLGDISFDLARGILSLPSFIVDDATESTYLNLVAFERCHVGAGHDITSFICFMDNIVDQDGDISLLSSKQIILNFIGTDKAAADLFNTMSKDLTVYPSTGLYEVRRDIDTYCKRCWPKWRAKLMRDYFGSPWSFISVVAAFLLFAMTAASTAGTFIYK